MPQKVNIDKSGANKLGISQYNEENKTNIEIRQCKYLNNIVEQDHRTVKRKVRPMLGFQSFRTARITIAGIELINMLRKKQFDFPFSESKTYIDEFYALAK